MTPYFLRRLAKYAAALAVGIGGVCLAYGGGWYAAHRAIFWTVLLTGLGGGSIAMAIWLAWR